MLLVFVAGARAAAHDRCHDQGARGSAVAGRRGARRDVRQLHADEPRSEPTALVRRSGHAALAAAPATGPAHERCRCSGRRHDGTWWCAHDGTCRRSAAATTAAAAAATAAHDAATLTVGSPHVTSIVIRSKSRAHSGFFPKFSLGLYAYFISDVCVIAWL